MTDADPIAEAKMSNGAEAEAGSAQSNGSVARAPAILVGIIVATIVGLSLWYLAQPQPVIPLPSSPPPCAPLSPQAASASTFMCFTAASISSRRLSAKLLELLCNLSIASCQAFRCASARAKGGLYPLAYWPLAL